MNKRKYTLTAHVNILLHSVYNKQNISMDTYNVNISTLIKTDGCQSQCVNKLQEPCTSN